jgi:hypothetical protein
MGRTLGTVASITAGRTKVYDVSIPADYKARWVPAMVLLSSESFDCDWELYVDKDVNNLIVAGAVVLTPATTGGSILRNTTVYVRVTAVDATGESRPTDGCRTATTGATTDTNKIAVSWTSVAGATSYNVYVGSLPGGESFFGDTTGTSLDVTEIPTNDPFGIPTLPSVHGFNALNNITTPAIKNIEILRRLQVFAVTTGSTRVSFSMPLE